MSSYRFSFGIVFLLLFYPQTSFTVEPTVGEVHSTVEEESMSFAGFSNSVLQAPRFLMGPIEGVTTAWHPAPERIAVPAGTDVRFQLVFPPRSRTTLTSSGLSAASHEKEAYVGECSVANAEQYVVTIEGVTTFDQATPPDPFEENLSRPRGERELSWSYRCVIEGVDISPEDIVVSQPTLSVEPFFVDETLPEADLNQLTYAYYSSRESIASLLQTSSGYATSIGRTFRPHATVSPVEFSSVLEWRVNGAPQLLESEAARISFDAPGVYELSVGPPSSELSLAVQIYETTITSHVSNSDTLYDGETATFTAVTNPPGFEDSITWLSSTSVGRGSPVVGTGPSFTVTFDDTWADLEGQPVPTQFQWLGVKADHVIFNQDRKCPPDCPMACAVDTDCDAPGNPCLEAQCVMNLCQDVPQTNGFLCPDDGDTCTNDLCVGGTCVHPQNDNPDKMCGGGGGSGFGNGTESARADVTGTGAMKGDPVNLFTGAHHMEVTDLHIPGRGLDFIWTRTYDSNLRYENGWELGSAWGSPYLQRLIEVDGSDIDYVAGTGRTDRYAFLDGVTWQNAAHYYQNLVHNAGAAEFIITKDGERTLAFHDFGVSASPGRLKRIEDRFGNQMSFEYVANLLVQIRDTFGRAIDFSYYPDGTIQEISDFSGRTIRYTYYQDGDGAGNTRQLRNVQAPEVSGTSTGNDFSGASRKTTTYTYNTNSADPLLRNQLLTITDPKAQTYLQNIYADSTEPSDFLFNRVVEQIYGNGSFHFHYAPIQPPEGSATMLVIVNDRRGIVSETRLNDSGNPVSERRFTGFADPTTVTTEVSNRPVGQVRAGDPAFFETTTSYDAEGKRLVKTYPRGNFHLYEYNETASERHGENNITRSERNVGSVGGAVSQLVHTTEYEDLFQLIRSKTDARGNTTSFFYDFDESSMGDLNGDGDTSGASGLLVRIAHPPANLGLAGAGGPQEVIETFQYNQFGQQTRHVDGEGQELSYEYYPEEDPDGDGQNLIPGGNPVTGGYLRTITVDAGAGGLNLSTTYTYDPVGNITSTTDPRGHTTSYEVNALNQVVAVSSPQLSLFADDQGAQYEVAYVYDANDNIVQVWTEHENSSNSVPGENIANASSFDQANFFEVRYTYDILDNKTSKTIEVGSDPDFAQESLTTTYFYDASENLVRIRHPNLAEDEDAISYDERDLVYQTVVGNADLTVPRSITQRDYDGNANLSQLIHPSVVNRETFQYDGFDRLSEHETVGSSSTTFYSYDNNSNVTEERVMGPWDFGQPVVELSREEMLFDELNRSYETREHLFRQEDGSPIGGGAISIAVTEREFNRDHLVVRSVNPNNHETLFTYDGADRLRTIIDAEGNVREQVYGDLINVTAIVTTEQNPDGTSDTFTRTYAFDELNQLRRVEDDLANVTEFSLDSRGKVVARRDAEGNELRTKFDGLGRSYADERQVDESEFVEVRRRWDARSRLVEVLDGLLQPTRYTYDSHNRLIEQENADLTTRTYEWDVEGNLEEFTRENNERLVNTYDAANRLTQRQYHDSSGVLGITDEYQYNGLNALTAFREVGGHSIAYRLESRNHILECQQSIAGHGSKTFFMDYDRVGNPTELIYPGGRQVDYENYTNLELHGRITTAGAQIDYEYSGYGRIQSRFYNNGITLRADFDAIKRVSSYLHEDAAEVPVGFTHQRNGVHQVVVEEFLNTVDAENHNRVFILDDYYRTTGFIRELDTGLVAQALGDFGSIAPLDGEDHEVIDFDHANNLEQITVNGSLHTSSQNNMNELLSLGGLLTSAQYDDIGRLTSYVEGGDNYSLAWNLRDQLTEVRRNGLLVAEYEYYPDGMRAQKTVGAQVEHYYGPEMSVHEVYDVVAGPEEVLAKEFVFEGTDRPLVMFFDADSDPGTGNSGREAYFYHENPKGDIYALSDTNGTVVERYDYSLFGAPRFAIPGVGEVSESQFGNPFLFSGSFYDQETARYYMRYRYFDPVFRRFLSRDPIEDDSLGNLYAAFENHAGQNRDPWGLGTKGDIQEPAMDPFGRSFETLLEINEEERRRRLANSLYYQINHLTWDADSLDTPVWLQIRLDELNRRRRQRMIDRWKEMQASIPPSIFEMKAITSDSAPNFDGSYGNIFEGNSSSPTPPKPRPKRGVLSYIGECLDSSIRFLGALPGAVKETLQENHEASKRVFKAYWEHGWDGLEWGMSEGSLADQATDMGGETAGRIVQGFCGISLVSACAAPVIATSKAIAAAYSTKIIAGMAFVKLAATQSLIPVVIVSATALRQFPKFKDAIPSGLRGAKALLRRPSSKKVMEETLKKNAKPGHTWPGKGTYRNWWEK